jgi:hypothetical protein
MFHEPAGNVSFCDDSQWGLGAAEQADLTAAAIGVSLSIALGNRHNGAEGNARTKGGGNSMARFEAKRLSRLDWAVVGAGGLSFISLFLPWYGASAGLFSASVDGWSTSYGWFGALLIIAAGAYLALQRSEVNLSVVPLTPAVVVLGAAILGALIVIIRWITLPSGHAGVGGVTVYSYGPRVGIFLTIIAGLVQVGAALALFRASGEKLPWAEKNQGTSLES